MVEIDCAGYMTTRSCQEDDKGAVNTCIGELRGRVKSKRMRNRRWIGVEVLENGGSPGGCGIYPGLLLKSRSESAL